MTPYCEQNMCLVKLFLNNVHLIRVTAQII